MAQQAKQHLAQRRLSGRCTVIDDDMFSAPCPSAQRVILSQILHNWSTVDCIRLLGLVCAALEEAGPGSELWCIDGVLPPDGGYNPVIDRDMRMLTMFGRDGSERTLGEFDALMRDAGLTLVGSQSRRLPDNQTLLVAQPTRHFRDQ